MAKILGKDPVTYTKERDGFLRDLQHFHESRGTPFRRAPILSGHEIDLYLLYSLVTAHGGWIKVNSKNAWTELFEYFCVPGKCVNGSIALKQIYLRYLDRWEKVHYLGEEADRGSDDDEESRHKRWSARALHSVPLTYNYTQHNIAESTREYNHLSTDLYKFSDYDRLALSLLSPLPNEQDFAINVCTLLSNDGKHTLKIEKHPRLIDYLVAHAGVFNHHSLRKVFIDCYSKVRGQPLHTFWKDVLCSEEYVDLTHEWRFMTEKEKTTGKGKSTDKDKSTEKRTKVEDSAPISDVHVKTLDEVVKEPPEKKTSEPMIVDIIPSFEADSDSELFASGDIDPALNAFNIKLKPHPSDKDIFCLGRSVGTRDYVGQRVLQVATILRNLTFIDENIPVLTKNRTFIRFMLLCLCSRWNQLQNLGFDMLGNVASEFLVKDPQTDKLTFYLIKLVSNGLLSEDRNSCISSLDALNKLSQNEVNEDSLSRSLESFVYTRVCSFLTIHDVMLLIYTLECLYSLSSLGERSCNFIVGSHGVVDTLVSLVTVEGKSYGPKACIGMKLVETVPGGNSTTSSTNMSATAGSTTTTVSSTTVSSSSTTTTTMSTVSAVQVTPKAITTSTPQRLVQMAPQRLIAISPASTQAVTSTTVASPPTTTQSISPQQLVQQQHAHQQAIQENEQFALAWLRATYEPCSTGRVDHQELYKHYINSCAKIGRRGVIAPLHFPRCVRSVFGGTVGPNPVKPVNSTDPQFYDGIKARPQQLVINMQPVTTPVVQATPKTVRRKVPNVTVLPAATPTTPALTVIADNTDTPPASPASPILKAQLSAPPKPRETTVVTAISKGDIKSQVMAHPHLSQALLGSAASTPTQAGSSKETAGQSNTSLIKSLLATKVNECMTSVSMRTATDCQNVTTQVAARQQQQRLLAQQSTPIHSSDSKSSKLFDTTPKSSRINGARQLFSETETTTDSDVSSTTQNNNSTKNRREPPQPPPPPLAPLSNPKGKVLRIENEDSDSTGNNSLASSTGLGHVGLGGVSSTEDGDNSLTSFEGLLNGIPSLDNPLNDDSNSKDSLKNNTKKPLMLADLLEKKIEKDPMLLNGVLGKELRLGEKGLDLVENHIEKVLSKENNMNESAMDTGTNNTEKNNDINKQTLKRAASDELQEPDAKKIHLSNVNGNADSPAPDSVSSSNGDEQPTEKVSTAAAKLFADMAADILEDEDEEELMQEAQQQQQQQQSQVEEPNVVQIAQNSTVSQMYVDGNQQVLLQPRQIIVSQPQIQTTNQVVIPAGAQLKTQGGQTVIVQNSAQQRAPVMLQQANTGQILLSQGIQGLQGQVQLVASSSQPGQYVIQTGGPQNAYVVAQSQTAMVHGQPQTVLVAQTPQQQGTGTKTIIILQQQPAPASTATHHQKVVVTPQGQQVVVTQVQRPILQTSTVSNNPPLTSTVIKSVGSAAMTQVTTTTATTIGIVEKKIEEIKPRPKINRDLSTPFVCEWGDCQVETKFTSANQVYLHVCEEHVPKGSEEIICQWERCDNMKRKRFSLMTHLNDKHCNTEAMRSSLTRRRQMSHTGKVESPVSNTATPHPGYAPDAAFHAIKRHALEFVNPKELQDDNEGPVTKSIRLTASLILRNLVIYSSNCRRYLKHYEPHLANVALSNVESSRTIAQVLYDMNEGASHR